jgi:threonine aldolase
MALYHLDGLEDRLKQTVTQVNDLFAKLNKLPSISITALKGGTNIFDLKLTAATDAKKFRQALYEKHKVLIRNANHEGIIKLQVNETLLKTDNQSLVAAFNDALAVAKV